LKISKTQDEILVFRIVTVVACEMQYVSGI